MICPKTGLSCGNTGCINQCILDGNLEWITVKKLPCIEPIYLGWQLCPKCEGSGIMTHEGKIYPRDQCDVCNGKKIISTQTGLPPP